MGYGLSVAGHIAIGSAALLFYWVALLSVKGGNQHRVWGKACFLMLGMVALSVGPVLFLRPGEFEPASVIQFIYLAACLVTVCMLGWTSIRWKTELKRFRGAHFKAMGITILVLGLVVLSAGIASGRAVTMIFSWIGLAYGGAMIRFAWMKAEPHPRWWLGWHLNAVSGLFNAIHGTILALAWRILVDSEAGDGVTIAAQLGTVAAAIALRLWFGRSRGAPLSFTRPEPAMMAASSATAPQSPLDRGGTSSAFMGLADAVFAAFAAGRTRHGFRLVSPAPGGTVAKGTNLRPHDHFTDRGGRGD